MILGTTAPLATGCNIYKTFLKILANRISEGH